MNRSKCLYSPWVGVGVAFLACLILAPQARAGIAYVHVLRGRAQYQATGTRTWGPLPATLVVNGGDRIKVRAGSRVNVVYLKSGGKVTVRGPRVYTIRKAGRTGKPGRTSSVGLFKLLRLLVARNASYHKAGVASLSTSGKVAGFINLLGPRYGVVGPGKIALRWANIKRGSVRYRVAVWRYLAGGNEQRVTGAAACGSPVCVYTIPAAFVLTPGVRYYWNVKVEGSRHEPYPSVGVWFVVASRSVMAKLARDLKAAALKHIPTRSFSRAVAYAVHGFHQEALGEPALKKPSTANARKLKARLLCITCRAKQANRVARRPFCKCREDPDR